MTGRKLFLSGSHGRRAAVAGVAQRAVTLRYLEIQAGLATTQLEHLRIEGDAGGELGRGVRPAGR